MSKEKNIDAALSVLGEKFRLVSRKRNYAETESGKIIYRFSKWYEMQNQWWTSEKPERMLEVDYIMVELETLGIVLIPSKKLYQYCKENDVKILKDGRQNIRIKQENGHPVIFNKVTDPIFDLSPYFYSME